MQESGWRYNFPPAISAILPVFNGEKYLGAAIESILGQTFADFELLVIDDGSTDASLSIAKRYANIDSRVIIVSRQHRGLGACLNEGIDLARGQWIARMDADDIALPNRFEKQLAHLEKTQADFCGGAIEYFGSWSAHRYYPMTHEACGMQILFNVPIAHPTAVGKRSAFTKVRYNEKFLHCEDYDFWQRAWAMGFRMTNVSEIILRYRIHEFQVSSLYKNIRYQGIDLVRKNHWKALLPELTYDELTLIIETIGRQSGKTGILIPFLKKLLSQCRGESKEVFLFNCFRTFCRLAWNDLLAAKNWLLLVNSEQPKFRSDDLVRAVVLIVLSTFRLREDSSVSQYLRRFSANLNSDFV